MTTIINHSVGNKHAYHLTTKIYIYIHIITSHEDRSVGFFLVKKKSPVVLSDGDFLVGRSHSVGQWSMVTLNWIAETNYSWMSTTNSLTSLHRIHSTNWSQFCSRHWLIFANFVFRPWPKIRQSANGMRSRKYIHMNGVSELLMTVLSHLYLRQRQGFNFIQ